MTTREQVEAEAEEHVRGTDNGPDGYHGFIAGRTVSAEQVEAAAREYLHYTLTPNPSAARQSKWDRARRIVTTTFRAAGFYVMEATDE